MGFMDKAKDIAGDIKDKAGDVAEKAAEMGEKLADKLPDSIGDKVEKLIPGDHDGDGK